MNIEIEDRIRWYYSRTAKRAYPVYIFGGDTDMATQGKASLTSLERNEVVITSVTGDELNGLRGSGEDQFDARINLELGRNDLRCHRLRKTKGTSCEYEPLDIHDPTHVAEQRREERIASFLRLRGRGERDILRGPEGILFYVLLAASVLAMILYPRLTL